MGGVVFVSVAGILGDGLRVRAPIGAAPGFAGFSGRKKPPIDDRIHVPGRLHSLVLPL